MNQNEQPAILHMDQDEQLDVFRTHIRHQIRKAYVRGHVGDDKLHELAARTGFTYDEALNSLATAPE